MKRVGLFLMSVALMALGTACGGNDGGPAASGTPLPQVELTKECKELQSALKIDTPKAGTLPDFDAAADGFDRGTSASPDNIDRHLSTIAKGYRKLASDLRAKGLEPGDKITEDSSKDFTGAFAAVMSKDFQDAVSALATWLGQGCKG